MRCRIRAKTMRTSLATVVGLGIHIWGLPVFIKARNPRLATIWNGRLLSDTQRTTSALVSFELVTVTCTGPWTRRFSPHLSFCWLNTWVCNLSFTNMFKMWCEDPVPMLSNNFVSLFQIISIQCRLNNVLFPAMNGMFLEVTGQLCIAFVKVAPDMFATSFLCTNKLVKWSIVFGAPNLWNRFIEGINRWCPVTTKALYKTDNGDKSNI